MNANGFTLVELIIVLAIVAIIGAILIPNFLNTTDRARLRSDIQSVRVLQNALELHNIEQPIPISSGASISDIKETLDDLGYIEIGRIVAQTSGARFEVNSNGRIVLDISEATSISVRTTLYNQLSAQERIYVIRGMDG